LKESHPVEARGQFVGATPLRQIVAGVTLAEVVHTCGRELPPHVHRDPYLSLLITGRYEDSFAGQHREFQPADATYSPPGFEHRDRIGSGGATFFTVSFDPAAGDEYAESRAIWERPQRWDAWGPASCLARLHVQFLESRGQIETIDVDDCLFKLWSGLSRMRRLENRTAAWLGRARARLHDEFTRPPRISAMAAEEGLHPTYFSRAFRSRFGLTPAEYRNHLRVMAACRALAGRDSIKAIAINLGYADQPHFTRDFRARIGTAPGEYRRMINPQASLQREPFSPIAVRTEPEVPPDPAEQP